MASCSFITTGASEECVAAGLLFSSFASRDESSACADIRRAMALVSLDSAPHPLSSSTGSTRLSAAPPMASSRTVATAVHSAVSNALALSGCSRRAVAAAVACSSRVLATPLLLRRSVADAIKPLATIDCTPSCRALSTASCNSATQLSIVTEERVDLRASSAALHSSLAESSRSRAPTCCLRIRARRFGRDVNRVAPNAIASCVAFASCNRCSIREINDGSTTAALASCSASSSSEMSMEAPSCERMLLFCA